MDLEFFWMIRREAINSLTKYWKSYCCREIGFNKFNRWTLEQWDFRKTSIWKKPKFFSPNSCLRKYFTLFVFNSFFAITFVFQVDKFWVLKIICSSQYCLVSCELCKDVTGNIYWEFCPIVVKDNVSMFLDYRQAL